MTRRSRLTQRIEDAGNPPDGDSDPDEPFRPMRPGAIVDVDSGETSSKWVENRNDLLLQKLRREYGEPLVQEMKRAWVEREDLSTAYGGAPANGTLERMWHTEENRPLRLPEIMHALLEISYHGLKTGPKTDREKRRLN